MRRNQGRRSTITRCAIVVALTTVVSTSHVGAEGRDRPWSGSDAAALTLGATYDGWGAWNVPGALRHGVSIPDTTEVVGIDVHTKRLTRLDPRTTEATSGAVMPAGVFRLLVSPGATWVYAFIDEASVRRIARYSLTSLESDGSFGTGVSTTGPELAAAGVPGDEGLLLVASADDVSLFRDGELVGAGQPLDVFSMVVVDGTTAYAKGSGTGVSRITFGGTGVFDVAEVLSEFVDGFLRLQGPDMLIGDRLFSLPSFVERPATEFDLARPDPIYPARYFHDGARGIKIYDATSGALLVEPVARCLEDAATGVEYSGVIVGGGVIYDTNAGKVADIFDRCGSYGEFTPVPPDRVFDSRTGEGNRGIVRRLAADSTIRVKIHGRGGVPEFGVESVVLNVTAVHQANSASGWNYLTVWPAGYDQPTVSSVNVANGATVGNMVTVSTAADGHVDVYSNAGDVDLVIDVMGYFASAIAPRGSRYVSVPKFRAADTRNTGTPLGPGQAMTVSPGSKLGALSFPSWDRHDVTALVLNVTAVQSTTGGHLRVYPSGSALPPASSMNFAANEDVNRLVTVKTGPAGKVDVWNPAGFVDVVVDVVGAYVDIDHASQAGRFVGWVPFRWFDTREASPYPGDGRFPAGELRTFSVPYPEENLVANVTATQTAGSGYVSLGSASIDDFEPSGLWKTSSLNFSSTDETIGNQSIVFTGYIDGGVEIYTSTRTHLVVDLFGYYTARGSPT